jgi:hypothetical protein
MKTCIKSQLWILLIFVSAIATAQPRIVFIQAGYGQIPSQHELALLFAIGKRESVDFMREHPFNVSLSASDLNNSWATKTDSLNAVIANTQLTVRSNQQAHDFYPAQQKKSYSLYYMPTYKEINVELPKAQQVLNYFLTLGSSLYVTSLQSGRY